MVSRRKRISRFWTKETSKEKGQRKNIPRLSIYLFNPFSKFQNTENDKQRTRAKK